MELEQSILCGLNKEFSSNFCEGSQVQHETLQEGKETHQPETVSITIKTSLNILSDKKKNHKDKTSVLHIMKKEFTRVCRTSL